MGEDGGRCNDEEDSEVRGYDAAIGIWSCDGDSTVDAMKVVMASAAGRHVCTT